MIDYREIITSGGDERIKVNEEGLNKYFIDPSKYDGVFNRGSCTCNTLTDIGKEAVKKLLGRLKKNSFEKEILNHHRTLKKLINYKGEDKFYIFFAPSGSDLSYIPLMIARLLHPDKEIYSVVTCPEELGTGSLIALSGKYHFATNQFGEQVEKGAPISSSLKINIKTFPARDENGNIVDHKHGILDTINNNVDKYAVIGNLVIGSKSGIYDNVNIIPDASDKALWVVDLCQLRSAKSLIAELLDLNCMIMITGSKFYQSPPFCGAMLVPKSILDRIENIDKEVLTPFRSVFSKYDMPPEFPEIHNAFRTSENVGLLTRWEAAIAEIKVAAKDSTFRMLSGIHKWNSYIIDKLNAYPDIFDLMPNQELTNKTIISFRVKNKAGEYLNDEELRELYRTIVIGVHTGFTKYNKIIIGQPVKYIDRSFIRLALGSNDLRKLMDNNFDMRDDDRLVEIIKETVIQLFWS
jgi:hypothetical protein